MYIIKFCNILKDSRLFLDILMYIKYTFKRIHAYTILDYLIYQNNATIPYILVFRVNLKLEHKSPNS